MNRTLIAILAVLGAALPLAGAASERSDVLRREITLEPGGDRSVEIDNVFGDVTVNAGGEDRVVVEIRRVVRARDGRRVERGFQEVELIVDSWSGRNVVLMQDGPFRCSEQDRDRRGSRHRWGDCHWNPDYEIEWSWTVTVPADVHLEARTVNGGSVRVDGVRGDVEAANVNGEIDLAGLRGQVSAATVNGGIVAGYAAAPSRDGRFSTINGDVEIALPADSALDVSLQTMNGELWSDFEVATVPRRASATTRRQGHRYRLERDTQVRIGAGGPRFECQTLNGDIVLRAR